MALARTLPAEPEVAVASAADGAAWQACAARLAPDRHELAWPWRQVLQASFGHRPHFLLARHGERVTGVLPLVEVRSRLFGRALISLPHLNGGGLVAEDAATAAALVMTAGELVTAGGYAYGELRQGLPLAGAEGLTCRCRKVAMRLALEPDPARLFGRFPAKLRSQIRRPGKAGASAELVLGNRATSGQLAAFYRVFAEAMRDLGTPVSPLALFEATLRGFGQRAALCLVWLAGQPAAGGLLVGQGGRIEIIWAAARRRYNPVAVNMLLYWTAIEAACRQGYRVFDFGRSTPGSTTFRFKAQWGAEPTPLPWYYLPGTGDLPEVSPDHPRFRLAVRAWRHLPLALANRLGPLIAPSLP